MLCRRRHTTRRIAGFVVGCVLSFVLSPSKMQELPTAATTIPSKEEEGGGGDHLIDDELEEYTTSILQPADLDKSF